MINTKKPTPSEQCFWGLSGQIVKSIEPHSEADSMALLNQLLNAFGSIVGRGPHFRAEADIHGCNLFTLNVGNSSKGRKGTSWGQIRTIMELVDPAWIKANIKNGFGSGEGLIFSLRDDIGGDLSFKIPDKKLLILESEFGSMLKVVNKDGNTSSPTLRSAWDGAPLGNVTKGMELRSTNHHVSIIGHITKTELVQLLRQVEVMNGLANRFLFFYTERSKFLPNGGTLSYEERSSYASEIKSAVEFSRSLNEVKRSPEADNLWVSVYPKLSEGLSGVIGSLSSRSEAQVMRLALVITLMNKNDSITFSSLETALAIHDYCIQTLRYIFGNKTGQPMADKLYEFILTFEFGVSRTQIRDYFGRNSGKESIEDALQVLLDSKLAQKIEIPTKNGRPKEVWMPIKNDRLCTTEDANDINDQTKLMSYWSYGEGRNDTV